MELYSIAFRRGQGEIQESPNCFSEKDAKKILKTAQEHFKLAEHKLLLPGSFAERPFVVLKDIKI